MIQLKKLGIGSVARTLGCIYGGIALVFAPFAILVGFASMMFGVRDQRLGGGMIVAFAIAAPFFYGLVGALTGAIVAFVYNFIAEKFGGIELELTQTPMTGTTINAIGT
jgi:hypothetical protein